jgi:hypothetical protein
MDKFKSIFNPQVRMFLYGAVAAILSVATARNWISGDLAQSINENLPTILGALGSILAAANVKVPAKATPAPVAAPVVPDRVEPAPISIGVPQAGAIEEPIA